MIRIAITAATGSSAATEPLGVISAARARPAPASTQQQRRAVARAPHQLLPRPRRDAGGIQRLAHHEQRSDERHGGIPKPGEHLASLQDAGGVERKGRAMPAPSGRSYRRPGPTSKARRARPDRFASRAALARGRRTRLLTARDDLVPERGERDRDQLEVRESEGNADDRDAQRDSGDQVLQRKPPAE